MTDTGSGSATAASPERPALQLLPLDGTPTRFSGGVHSMAWTRDGGPPLLAVAHGSQGQEEVVVWELTGSSTLRYRNQFAHQRAVRSMAWARRDDQPLLATSDGSDSVHLWEAVEGEPITLTRLSFGEAAQVVSVDWIRDGHRLLLATGAGDGTFGAWELVDGDRTHTRLSARTAYPTSHVVSVSWARDGDRLLLATDHRNGFLQVWHLHEGGLVPLPSVGEFAPVQSMEWGRDGERLLLATGHTDGAIGLWTPGPRLERVGQPNVAHTARVNSMDWARVGHRGLLATGGGDGTVRLWQLAGDELLPLGEPGTAHTGEVTSVAWTAVGGRLVLATGDSDGALQLWEVVEDRPVHRLPAYRSDALGVPDELSRSDEARALAQLVTARSARPPLAVGLFGDWGEGKSHFLGLLQQQVDLVARAGNPLAHHAVRQVRFNAWHYAETGLWASLVAELFAQLAAPQDADDPGEAQRSMSRLTAELVTARNLRPRLDAARSRRDRLARALRERSLWDTLPDDQRQHLTALVGEDAAPARFYSQVAGGLSVARERLVMLRATVRSVGAARLALFVAGCAALAVGGLALARYGGRFGPHPGQHLPDWAAGIPGALPLVAGAVWLGNETRRTRARLRGAWEAARSMADRQRTKLLTAAEVAAAEVAALERQMQDLTAAGQLAGLIGDRAAAGDYRSQLGVMTQIREDFQRMAELLARAAEPDAGAGSGSGGASGDPSGGPGWPGGRGAPGGSDRPDVTGGASGGPSGRDEADDALPRIDRIVIYVDDLDRCPPARVVEMLEAIHLLLAVELFVVVVAIDPRWLLRAVAAHYRDVLDDASGEGTGASTPAQYLEKIFQVVLTLPALDAGGYARMIDKLVGVRDDREPLPASPPLPPSTAATGTGRTAPAPVPDSDSSSSEESYGPRVDAVRVVERTDPLTLEPDELALLRLLGPPHLVATPRAVTRMANSYGLLTALRRTHREADLRAAPGGVPPYRAGMVLLAALVSYPALGPALCLHLRAEAAARPDTAWRDFCAALPPPSAPADTHPQWLALRTALTRATDSAAAASLPLPMPLGAWREWVLPVARLSFPAGSIVPALRPE